LRLLFDNILTTMRIVPILLSLSFSLLSLNTVWAQRWISFPTVESVTRVAVMHDQAFIVSGNTLCVADTASVTDFSSVSRLNGFTGSEVFDIRYSKNADRLAIVYTDGNIDLLDANDKIYPIPDLANSNSSESHYPTGIAVRQDSLYVQTSTSTITVDMKNAIIVRSVKTNTDLSSLEESGSYSANLVTQLNNNLDTNHNWVKNGACMKLINGRLVVTESTHLFYSGECNSGIISILDLATNTWNQITRVEVEKELKNLTNQRNYFTFILTLGDDESDPDRFYTACDGSGFIEFRNDTAKQHYISSNCAGVTDIVENYDRVSAVHGDANGNLWVVCSGINEKQLRCRTASGNWIQMPIKGFTNRGSGFIEMHMTHNNPYDFIWLIRNYRWDEFGGALYYRNGTDTIVSDDESVHFSSLVDQDGNALAPQYLYSMIEDQEGVVWLLTSIGPCIVDIQLDFFNYASNSSTANIGKVRRVKIPRNDGTNLADYLLNNVQTVCGVVDAANNKWIGTSDDGIYHLSADGLTQLEHFTTDNSPLFSNAIQALEYDSHSGCLFVSTTGGICVYKTDAVEGKSNNDNIYCYPNPVRPNYSGKVYICNLKDQSDIRITDSTGHVVYNTTSFGGQTSWDICNNSGDRVKPGIYYIFSIDSDGKDGGVTKLLVQ